MNEQIEFDLIKEAIASEDRTKPMTQNQISAFLFKRGVRMTPNAISMLMVRHGIGSKWCRFRQYKEAK